MRTPAAGAVLVLAGSWGCWGGHAAAPVPEPAPTSLDPSSHDPSGRYWCSIDDEKLEHHCEIVRDGKLRLTKLNGAERVRGELTVEGDDLVFVGERWCMWTECKEKLHGRFVPGDHGTYRGTFQEAPLVVRLAPMPANTPPPPPDDQTVDRGAPVGQ